jgi:photosystem II stability/assembly factor-like uncharacterized protein
LVMGFGPYNTPSGTLHFCTPEDGLLTCSGNVFRTNDGGHTWAVCVVTKHTDWIESRCYPVYIISPQIGLAGGSNGRIHRTEDGGNTWSETRVEDPAEFLAFAFANNKVGYAGADNGLLYRTEDGGRTWTKLALSRIGGVTRIVCPNDLVCWIVAIENIPTHEEIALAAYHRWVMNGRPTGTEGLDWAAAQRELTLPGGIFCSTDAGHSWVDRTPPNTAPCDLSINAGGDVFALYGYRLYQIRPDGATEWKLDAIKSVYNGGLWYFAALTSDRICLAGYDTSGAVIVTHDGGKTWQRPSDAADNGPTCLYFLDEKHGWCMSGNYAATSTVCGTNDGGSTWKRRRIL